MRKRARRFPVIALVAALAWVIALSGCAVSAGSTSSDSSASSASDASSSNSASVADESNGVELTVASDSRMMGALSEVEALYSERFPNVSFSESQPKNYLDLGLAGDEGKSPDILLTDSRDVMDAASSSGSIDDATRFEMLSEDIVFVVASNSTIKDLTLANISSGAYSVAIGDDSVLSGNCANQSLSTVGCFIGPDGKTGALSSGKANETDVYAGTPLEDKVVSASSDEDACGRVVSGEADVAMVRSSVAFGFNGVKVVGIVPLQTHESIVYSVAVCADGAYPEEAQSFIDWANSDSDALDVWSKWGISWAS